MVAAGFLSSLRGLVAAGWSKGVLAFEAPSIHYLRLWQ